MKYEVSLPDAFYDFKKLPMMKHGVVAGGYLRDQVLGIEPTDIDIFIPFQSTRTFANSFWSEFGALPDIEINDGKATDYDGGMFIKYDVKYKGLDFDVIGKKALVDEFGHNLIEEFPWANQQIYHDGKKSFSSEHFDNDIDNRTMSLLHVRNLESLPQVMDKYTKVRDKMIKQMGLRIKFKTDYILTKATGDDWL